MAALRTSSEASSSGLAVLVPLREDTDLGDNGKTEQSSQKGNHMILLVLWTME
jgi:hypothetical protein